MPAVAAKTYSANQRFGRRSTLSNVERRSRVTVHTTSDVTTQAMIVAIQVTSAVLIRDTIPVI